ncbi:MAG: asparagine synthase (glutamine-hydrolyzing) [Clostridia bacterium]|nr:asparagine synthase (glutamine-hydrolyzing) [Clostridia bacterium]
MCGIAGWIDFKRNLMQEENILQKMASNLIRRGPDEGDCYCSENVALIHRRLIVIDPENGKQPMRFRDYGKDLVFVYNGELYNTEEVRGQLIEKGYLFSGHSDTEVLLKAFACWGEECLEKLNGIYAFAIWDNVNKTLTLARDRMGVKPLFYYPYHGGILFASELKALLVNPLVKHEIEEDGLHEIFSIGPGRTPGCGVIKGVKEVKPGCFLRFSQQGIEDRQYWKLEAKEHKENLAETIEHTRFLIKDAITKQLVSDVPLCCFLSGGLDSSIISKLAGLSYREKNLGKLTTYSIDYEDNDKYFVKTKFQPNSDSEFIDAMVKDIGSEHRKVILNNEKLAEALDIATGARDLPGMADIDSSLVLFCEEIKKDFTVALSGECADEVFAGYPWYHDQEILFDETFPWSRSLALRKFILKENVLPEMEEYVHYCYEDTVKETDHLEGESRLNARMREMFMLNINWFMQTLLDRKDRMSMYNGLEVRVPFCDHRLVEYSFNMPWEYKALEGREKGIIREAVKDLLPEEIVWRKKSPYPKTHHPVYMKLVSEKVREIFRKKESFIGNFVKEDAIEEIIANPEKIAVPWYGQLMRAPQMLAYLIQVEKWAEIYQIQVV